MTPPIFQLALHIHLFCETLSQIRFHLVLSAVFISILCSAIILWLKQKLTISFCKRGKHSISYRSFYRSLPPSPQSILYLAHVKLCQWDGGGSRNHYWIIWYSFHSQLIEERIINGSRPFLVSNCMTVPDLQVNLKIWVLKLLRFLRIIVTFQFSCRQYVQHSVFRTGKNMR